MYSRANETRYHARNRDEDDPNEPVRISHSPMEFEPFPNNYFDRRKKRIFRSLRDLLIRNEGIKLGKEATSAIEVQDFRHFEWRKGRMTLIQFQENQWIICDKSVRHNQREMAGPSFLAFHKTKSDKSALLSALF